MSAFVLHAIACRILYPVGVRDVGSFSAAMKPDQAQEVGVAMPFSASAYVLMAPSDSGMTKPAGVNAYVQCGAFEYAVTESVAEIANLVDARRLT